MRRSCRLQKRSRPARLSVVLGSSLCIVGVLVAGCGSQEETPGGGGGQPKVTSTDSHEHAEVRSEQDQAQQLEREQGAVDAIKAAGGRWTRLDGAVISVDLTECPYTD